MNESATTKLLTKNNQRGASLVEYSLLVALIAIVAIVAVRSLGTVVRAQLRQSSSVLIGSGSITEPDQEGR